MTNQLDHNTIIQDIYEKALKIVSNDELESCYNKLDLDEKNCIDIVCKNAEAKKGVLTVLITSLVHKIFDPEQDIRLHQDNMRDGEKRGYSGRGVDTRYITPFMKQQQFPSMSESGWLTRSLEQNYPYNLDYGGSISPQFLKQAFLSLLNYIEEENKDAKNYLKIIFANLIIQRNKKNIDLAKPTSLSINKIVSLLKQHFEYNYGMRGASRLPTLAIYAVYMSMIDELKRFENKILLPLEEHTSSDVRSGRVGDIEIHDSEDRVFEAVEIKHNITITLQLVKDAYEKFKAHPINRYYILTTADKAEEEDKEDIISEINKISNIHGCQVIVNGIYPSLKYYLRLLNDTFSFIDHYVDNIRSDRALKFAHKEKWNEIVATEK